MSLECRDLAHAWVHANDEIVVTRQGLVKTFDRVLVCERCETARTDTFVVGRKTIDKVRTRYRYPDGYLVKGHGRTPIREVRWELFHNILKGRRHGSRLAS